MEYNGCGASGALTAFASSVSLTSTGPDGVPSFFLPSYNRASGLFKLGIFVEPSTGLGIIGGLQWTIKMQVPPGVGALPKEVEIVIPVSVGVRTLTVWPEEQSLITGLSFPFERMGDFLELFSITVDVPFDLLTLLEVQKAVVQRRRATEVVSGVAVGCVEDSTRPVEVANCKKAVEDVNITDFALLLVDNDLATPAAPVKLDVQPFVPPSDPVVAADGGIGAGAVVGIVVAVVVVVGIVALAIFLVRRGGDEYRPDDDDAYDDGRPEKDTFDEDDDIEMVEPNNKKNDFDADDIGAADGDDDDDSDEDTDKGEGAEGIEMKTVPEYELPPDYNMVKEYLA